MFFTLFQKTIILTVSIIFATQISYASQTANLHLIVTNPKDELVINYIVRIKLKDKIIREIQKKDEKPLLFSNLEAKEYLLEIESPGFKTFSQNINLIQGTNNLTIKLEIQEIDEKVEVKRDAQEKRVDDAFSGFFTREQIDSLPETGEEIEKELKRIYGQDTIIRVDGYGNRVPPKSRIGSIKASQSSYDAENHELGFTYIDITTKVAEESITGSVGFNFNNQYLNARNPFSLSRLPEQTRPINFTLWGPVIQNKTSFDLWLIQNNQTSAQNVIAVLPTGRVNQTVNSNSQTVYFNLGINHNLSKTQFAKFWYSFSDDNSKNLGVGGFDLPERAFDSKFRQNTFRFSTSGYIGKRFFNEFRSEFLKTNSRIIPNNVKPAIIVLDAFSQGGATNNIHNQTQKITIANNFLFGYQDHALKIGGLFEFERMDKISRLNENGTFTFSSLDNFITNKPSLFTQKTEATKANVTQIQLGVFFQDDFRIKKNLNLSLGLRYEWQNNLSDSNNFSPRLGFTWSPFKSANLTFRGGIGVFYDWLDSDISAFIANQSIDQTRELIIVNPAFPTLIFSNVNQNKASSYWQKATNLKNPYIIHSSFGFDSQLNKRLSLRGNYVFQKGVHQFRARNINAPFIGNRPNDNEGDIIQVESSAFFVRNSLDLGLNGNIKKGISFGLNYKIQKTTSDSEGVFGLPSNNYNVSLDRSLANNDQRHRIYSSINWKIRRGLLASAIYSFNSPLPYTITTGIDNNNDNSFNDRPLGILRNSERGNWRRQLDIGVSWTFSFFNYKGEKKGKTAIIYTEDEITRDNETTDSNKRFSMKIFLSAKNILNQTNFSQFIGVQTSPYFNQAISSKTPRRIDIGLRFNF